MVVVGEMRRTIGFDEVIRDGVTVEAHAADKLGGNGRGRFFLIRLTTTVFLEVAHGCGRGTHGAGARGTVMSGGSRVASHACGKDGGTTHCERERGASEFIDTVEN